ncbi:MAG TPA: sulfite exporter TauE/SafE family protein [Pyrinomonadaceae bacterium]|jgi:uncharacterized membrane protein YfcA|nr:sulfite exporter TauE/SafE family protein [Pyrinomonadaceae bacterium]
MFEILIIAAILLVAILYSSVGHAGASGYLAVMALLSVAPDISRPTALTLNIFVAIIATVQFYRAGYFDWRTFLSFAVTSVPFAFLGGMIHLPIDWHKKLLGAVLLFTAFRFLWKFAATDEVKQVNLWLALGIGALLGLLSGLTGVGGGIFLTPLLLFANWAETKKAAGISALFILVNSIAGLLGIYTQIQTLPPTVWFWVLAAIVGGIIGSTLGSRYFAIMTLRRILSVVLVIAGVKLIFT